MDASHGVIPIVGVRDASGGAKCCPAGESKSKPELPLSPVMIKPANTLAIPSVIVQTREDRFLGVEGPTGRCR